MQTVEIHLTPENFPRTNGTLHALIEAIAQESIAYCETNQLPVCVGLSVANGLLFQMKREIESQMIQFQEKAHGKTNETHLYQATENGGFVPFATGPEFTPIQNPNDN